ncbi:MAG: outer membrane protein transport protein [Myxococcales bacterium]|nr:outer membrane protein transport protein [Myxococcales bacterium]
MNRHLSVFMILLATCGWSKAVSAGAQDLFGYGARATAMGGAVVALCYGFESVYYNPAGLAVDASKQLTIGYQGSFFALDVDGGAPGADNAADVDRAGGVVIGAVVPLPLPDPIFDRIVLGIGLFVPDRLILRAYVPKPYTPDFVVLGNRANTVAIQGAAGVKITDWLYAGLGVRALATLVGDISVAPNAFGQLGSTVKDELLATYSLTAGFRVGPLYGFSAGFVFRGEQKSSFDLPIRADLGDSFPLEVPTMYIRGIAQFDPMQLGGSVSWSMGPMFSAEAGLLYRQWSAFGRPIENVTPATPQIPSPRFADTLSPRFGAESEWSLGPEWSLTGRLGYVYEPTPVPQQRGANNYLDNERHISSLGIAARYSPTSLQQSHDKGFSIQLDLTFQHHALISRKNVKITPRNVIEEQELSANPGYPHIESSGQLFGFGAALTLGFL